MGRPKDSGGKYPVLIAELPGWEQFLMDGDGQEGGVNRAVKAYVIHVRGHTQREASIRRTLEGLPIDWEFVLDANLEDLEEDFLARYFKGGMRARTPKASCASKHLLAYERIARRGGEGFSLVLEDDVRFYPGRFSLLALIERELGARGIARALVSIEDDLNYVPYSQRRPGTLLYPQSRGRLAGAYLIDVQGAEAVLAHASAVKLGVQMDTFHNVCAAAGVLELYWSEPVLAFQAGNAGLLPSLLDGRKNLALRKYLYPIRRAYKRLKHRLR